jgi:ATP-dependent Clp protease ATP-binding subunit ClpB
MQRKRDMRQDKLTTKFQQALSDAQSLAVGHDNPMIAPAHLLLALMQQEDGATSSLLSQAGVNAQALKTALDQAVDRRRRSRGTAAKCRSAAIS